MKICKIKNCHKKHYGLGYCQRHYCKFIFYPSHKKYVRQYQKEYRLKKYGIGNKIKPCQYKGCKNNTYANHKFCAYHNWRIKNRKEARLPLDLSIKCVPKGERNYMWKGGIATYPNHYLMKKNRLIILLHNPICEICKKKPATEVHHKDFSKTNHQLSNLQAVCHPCNSKLRNPNKPATSRYRRIYGLALYELQERFGYSYPYWRNYTNRIEMILKG